MDSTPWYALGETQGFYWTPQNTKAHSGIDLGTEQGRPITAPFDATQISEGTEAWGGQENILVKDAGGNYEVLSWLHMSSEQPLAPGSPIHAGDLLGYSGTPPAGYGNGPHIHFERTLGRTPPYMGYNPWYPKASSYPLTPQPVLDQLKSGGEGGTLGGASGGFIPSLLSGAGAAIGLSADAVSDPVGIIAAGRNLQSAIGSDVQNVQNAMADALKRAGVFLIGIILALVGLWIIFGPTIEQAMAGAKQEAQGIVGGGGSGAGAGGAVAKLAELAA